MTATDLDLHARAAGQRLRGLAVIVVAASIAAMPGPAAAESITDAMAAAYRYNPRLDAERARLRATDEEVARANSGFRPTVSANADAGKARNETRPHSPADGDVSPKSYGLTVTQPIFNGFRTVNTVREAEAGVRAGREVLRNIEQSVILEAATAYADVVRDMEFVRLRENNVGVLTRELKATRERKAVGEVTKTDVSQAEARRAAAVSALDAARANLQASRAVFERVVGHPPSHLTGARVPEKLLPRTQPEALAIALRENPGVITALYREQAARHGVDKIWGELLPSIQLDASYQRRYDINRLTDETEQAVVTGRVAVPLYTSGEVEARVRQSKHTHVSRLQEIEQSRTEAQSATISAWAQLVAARSQLEADQVQVRSTQAALQGVREEERGGTRMLIDVLNAELEALNAEIQLTTTRRNLVVAAYTLLSAIGRLDAASLGLTDKVYDPEVHYHEVRRQWRGVSITYADGRREHHQLSEADIVPQPMK